MSLLLRLLPFILPSKILGLPTAGLLAAAPDIIAGVKVLGRVIDKLKESGKSEKEATGAAAQMVAKARTMTPDEERIWADRHTLPAN